ncbi:hypothetical protein Droror1_Dr00001362 [Drosera rotundifolia]
MGIIHMPQRADRTRIRTPFSPRGQGSCRQPCTSYMPRGHFAIYVGNNEEKKRFVVPISYLKHPLFQQLLRKAEEEFGYDYGEGGVTVPCSEYYFNDLLSRIHNSR